MHNLDKSGVVSPWDLTIAIEGGRPILNITDRVTGQRFNVLRDDRGRTVVSLGATHWNSRPWYGGVIMPFLPNEIW